MLRFSCQCLTFAICLVAAFPALAQEGGSTDRRGRISQPGLLLSRKSINTNALSAFRSCPVRARRSAIGSNARL